MHGSMNIHFCASITVGQLERCGEGGLVVFRRVVVTTENGEQFELTVFGETELKVEGESNE